MIGPGAFTPSPRALLVSTLLVAPSAALAQESVEVGILKDEDIEVVQDVLFPKKGRTEIGVALGWMPFDPLVTTPNLDLTIDHHLSETVAISALIGGGYGLKTARYKELEGPAYGVAPYAYRYLASAVVGASWSPIYAKMALNAKKVIHYDIYLAGRVGATLEQSVIPDGGITVAPTLSLGIGARFFVSDGMDVRFEVRDDLLLEYRNLTSAWYFKQNGAVMLGVGFMLGKGGSR